MFAGSGLTVCTDGDRAIKENVIPIATGAPGGDDRQLDQADISRARDVQDLQALAGSQVLCGTGGRFNVLALKFARILNIRTGRLILGRGGVVGDDLPICRSRAGNGLARNVVVRSRGAGRTDSAGY